MTGIECVTSDAGDHNPEATDDGGCESQPEGTARRGPRKGIYNIAATPPHTKRASPRLLGQQKKKFLYGLANLWLCGVLLALED